MTDNTFEKVVATIVWGLIAFFMMLIVMGLFSCTPERAMIKLDRTGRGAEYCEARFPVKTEFIKGDSVVTFDTLYQYVDGEPIFDTVLLSQTDTVLITKKVDVVKYITRTVRVVDTLVKESTAKVALLQGRINDLRADNGTIRQANDKLQGLVNKARKQRNTAYWLIVLLIGLIARKPIMRLIKLII